jgi:type IX secretion system PorP/SprF family membrane protein
MRRKYLIAFVLFLGSVTVLKAQQDPYYTHFKFNKQAYNPASVGERNDLICLNTIAHRQWTGFDDVTAVERPSGQVAAGGEIVEDVAPITYNFNIGGQIVSQKRKKTFGAVGLSIYDDKIGFFHSTTFKAQAAYFIPIQGKFARLSIGLEAGMYQYSLEKNQFRALQQFDPRIPPNGSNIDDQNLDLGFGIYYKQRRFFGNMENFYAGVSMSHLTAPKYDLVWTGGQMNIDQERHIYFVTGVNIPVGASIELEPSILIKSKSKTQFDANVTALYNQTIRGGLGYRQWGNIDALSLMVGYVLGEIQVGYSYDITLSRIRQVSNGTHEVMLSYCFPFQVKPPVEKIHFYRNTRWL